MSKLLLLEIVAFLAFCVAVGVWAGSVWPPVMVISAAVVAWCEARERTQT